MKRIFGCFGLKGFRNVADPMNLSPYILSTLGITVDDAISGWTSEFDGINLKQDLKLLSRKELNVCKVNFEKLLKEIILKLLLSDNNKVDVREFNDCLKIVENSSRLIGKDIFERCCKFRLADELYVSILNNSQAEDPQLNIEYEGKHDIKEYILLLYDSYVKLKRLYEKSGYEAMNMGKS